MTLPLGLRDPSTHTFPESSRRQLSKFRQKYKYRDKDNDKDKDKDKDKEADRINENITGVLYFWNPDDSSNPIMMVDTSCDKCDKCDKRDKHDMYNKCDPLGPCRPTP